MKAEDKDVGKNAKMAYMITQGNDQKLFCINSTSGEVFLVAPLPVTANDSIVLVVSVVDIFSTNSSFQDTTVVKMTFYGEQNYSVDERLYFSLKSLKNVLIFVVHTENLGSLGSEMGCSCLKCKRLLLIVIGCGPSCM